MPIEIKQFADKQEFHPNFQKKFYMGNMAKLCYKFYTLDGNATVFSKSIKHNASGLKIKYEN